MTWVYSHREFGNTSFESRSVCSEPLGLAKRFSRAASATISDIIPSRALNCHQLTDRVVVFSTYLDSVIICSEIDPHTAGLYYVSKFRHSLGLNLNITLVFK